MDSRHLWDGPAESEDETAKRVVCEADLEALEKNPILRIVAFIEWIAKKCIQVLFGGIDSHGGSVRLWEENTTITGASSMAGEIGAGEPFLAKRVDNKDGSYYFRFASCGATRNCYDRSEGKFLLQEMGRNATITTMEFEAAKALLPEVHDSGMPW